ncbi:WD repeat-containing protein 36-like, partial [Sinocyclocheilus grahami]|uniref:WD repeat-containing protein 36-like n=1 Tax=Sinocyclocheilus grahami TaxID=75366 RepID=UPI0007ACB138
CNVPCRNASLQTPAVDVVGVGLASGQIIIHNIRFDETLMKFQQDWGPVTALSFRTDGHPIMASGSPIGHIGLWDLEEKKFVTQMRNAHTTAIAGLTFLQNEPILITNGADNAIRVWIFDVAGGDGRLLRQRTGHSAPPTKIQHHDQSSLNILSAGQDGTLQSFSTVHERFNKSLGHGTLNKTRAKKKGVTNDTAKLPAITTFASETARQSDWDGIIACHRGFLVTTTWNYQRGSIGAHKLEPERFNKNRSLNVHATAVDITSCGNFAVIALSSGHIDVYNMQSGFHRGHYGKDKAHAGAVRGLSVDALNQLTVSVGADRLLKIWRFRSKELLHTHSLPAAPASSLLHRDRSNNTLCSLVSLRPLPADYEPTVIMLPGTCPSRDTEEEEVLDADSSEMAEYISPAQLDEHLITLSLLPDSRWKNLLHLDIIKKKNKPKEPPKLPKAAPFFIPTIPGLVPQFALPSTPSENQVNTIDNVSIEFALLSVWFFSRSNNTLCSLVSLRPLPADYEPTVIMLPGTCPSRDTEEEEVLDADSSEMAEYISPAQLDEHLITLSLLPDSRWKNLLHLDIIKKKNKPKEPPKLPKAAPFFIPTIPGLVPQFALPSTPSENQSKIVNLGVLAQKSTFYLQLENALDNNSYEEPVKLLRELGPSAIETELRSLSPDMGGDVRVMQSFLKMISSILQSKRDFDLAQAYLALFLKLHLRFIADQPELMEEAESVSAHLEETWMSMQTLLNQNICLLSYIKSALL